MDIEHEGCDEIIEQLQMSLSHLETRPLTSHCNWRVHVQNQMQGFWDTWMRNSVSAGHGAGTEGQKKPSSQSAVTYSMWTFGSGAAKRAFESISLSCKLQPCIFNFLRIMQFYSAASKPNTAIVRTNQLSWLSLRRSRVKQIRLRHKE